LEKKGNVVCKILGAYKDIDHDKGPSLLASNALGHFVGGDGGNIVV
jgi:hypothetical protein